MSSIEISNVHIQTTTITVFAFLLVCLGPLESASQLATNSSSASTEMPLFGRSILKSQYNAHGELAPIDTSLQAKWIAQAVADLKREDVKYQEIFLVDRSYENFVRMEYKVSDNGVIKFKDGSFLKIITHSSHDNPKIGDMTCAINDKGRIYIHQGHNCGGIIRFMIDRKIDVVGVDDFINQFYSDIDGSTWTLFQ